MLAGKDLVEAAGTIFTIVNWDNFSGWHFDLNLGKEAYILAKDIPVKSRITSQFARASSLC